MGMIDSGSASTVCGPKRLQRWLKVKNLPKMRDGERKYRFGDGRVTLSVGNVVLSCQVKATDGSITEVKIEFAT